VFGPNWNGLDIPRHLNHFSRPTLRATLTEAGWKTVSIRPQLQGSSLGGSLQHSFESRVRKRPYRPEGPLYMTGAAAGTLLSATPVAAFIEAIAVPDF
jgi:hypothetical protein